MILTTVVALVYLLTSIVLVVPLFESRTGYKAFRFLFHFDDAIRLDSLPDQ